MRNYIRKGNVKDSVWDIRIGHRNDKPIREKMIDAEQVNQIIIMLTAVREITVSHFVKFYILSVFKASP